MRFEKLAQMGEKAISLVVPGIMLLAPVLSHAALPSEATAAFTAVTTDGASMVAGGWPIVVAVSVGLVMIGIFKKVIGRAT